MENYPAGREPERAHVPTLEAKAVAKKGPPILQEEVAKPKPPPPPFYDNELRSKYFSAMHERP